MKGNNNEKSAVKKKSAIKSGLGFGTTLAMIISYTTWRSVGLAIFHGLLGWAYVIYFIIVH